jgi:IS30 family transposase
MKPRPACFSLHLDLARTVTDATIELLALFKDCVLTITADNGKEFAYHKEVSKELDCGYYFADPYCSWQRGLNENTNGLLRQYWPKSTDFKLISDEDVRVNLVQLNNRPRKKLFFKTPLQMIAGPVTLVIETIEKHINCFFVQALQLDPKTLRLEAQ